MEKKKNVFANHAQVVREYIVRSLTMAEMELSVFIRWVKN